MDESTGCLGAILAACVSWNLNHDIAWAIFHALCGWFYLIYVLIVRFVL